MGRTGRLWWKRKQLRFRGGRGGAVEGIGRFAHAAAPDRAEGDDEAWPTETELGSPWAHMINGPLAEIRLPRIKRFGLVCPSSGPLGVCLVAGIIRMGCPC